MLQNAGIGPIEGASPETLGFDPTRLARLGPWMQRYVDTGRLPGAQVLIARRGAVAYAAEVGHCDVEGGRPWARDALARIYSMTKPLTSTALLMLYEQGLCHLDDPVDLFLPEFKDRRVLRPDARSPDDAGPAETRMTLHHLMTHTSGLTYGFQEGMLAEAYREVGVDFSVQNETLAVTAARLGPLPLAFEPGTRWHYSVSTDVLGRVVEVISGRTLDAFLRERILDPLGMADTFFGVPGPKASRLAALYAKTPEGGMTLSDTPASRFGEASVVKFSGGGGLVSTAGDYLRFAEMQRLGGELGGERILGPRTMRLMTMNHLPGDLAMMGQKVWAEVSFEGIGFGLGGAVMLDPARAQTLGSPGDFGWGGMASTVYWVDPAEQMSVVFLTQLIPSSAWPIRKELRALIYAAITD